MKKKNPSVSRFSSAVLFLCLSILFTSCLVRGYTYEMYYPTGDNGWQKHGYWAVLEPEYQVDADATKDDLNLFVLTKFNAPHWIKDTVTTIHFTRFTPYFENGDTLVRDTTDNDRFVYVSRDHEKITNHKELHLVVAYERDSAGSKSVHEKNYLLHRRSHYWFAVH